MQQFLTFCIFITLLLASATTSFGQEGYKITVSIEGYQNDTCILGYRLGKQTFVKDTLSKKNEAGQFVFEGDKNLKGGIYLVLTKPDNKYLEFLVSNDVDQKNMVLSTKMDASNDLSKNLKIEGSADNAAFLDYLKFLAGIRLDDTKLAEQLKLEESETEKKNINLEREKLGKKVKEYQTKMIQDYPRFLSSSLVAASFQPEVPPGLSRADGYYYYRNHYWDSFNWWDARLIRTPIFKSKLEYWTDKLTVQMPDSVISSIDYILDAIQKAGNKDMFQYVAAEMLNKYAKTKVICMDAVYVSLGEKYYCTGKADWVDSAQLVKICDNVKSLKPLRCGLYAPNIRLKKMDGTPINLFEVKAKFTALYFWDPDCGNCSKTTDKLVPVYNKWKDKGFEVFGVCSKSWKDIDKCKKKIEDKAMDFINTSDEAYPLAVAKKIYDIKVNPFLILLDEDKKIMWKRIDPNQLDDILKREFGEDTDESQEKP